MIHECGSELVTRRQVQELMWGSVGLERDGVALRGAVETMERWRVEGESVEALETRNLLQLGRLLAKAALEREESRGAHFRTDFPETREEWRRSIVVSRPVEVGC